MLSYLKGNINLFTKMSIISPVRSQMDTIFNSYLRRGLILIPIAAGAWVLSMYISSQRAFARVRRLSIHSDARPSDHVGVCVDACMKIGYLPGHVSFISLESIFSRLLPEAKYFNERPPGWRAKYDGKNNCNGLIAL